MKKKFSIWWSFTKNILLFIGLFLVCYACSEDLETKSESKTYSLLNNIKVVSTTNKSGRVEEESLTITINGVETVAKSYENEIEGLDNDDDDFYHFFKGFEVAGDGLPSIFHGSISLLFDKSTGEFVSHDIVTEDILVAFLAKVNGLVGFIYVDLSEGNRQESGLLSIDPAKAKINFDFENQTFTMTYQGDVTVNSKSGEIGFVPEKGTSIEIDMEVSVEE